jgi:hypothetical protein
MITSAIKRLEFLCNEIPSLLTKISESDFSVRPSPNKWSKKEILGHLIDSATNNHHRIVRGQFEDQPKINYDNHVWNKGNHYYEIPGSQLISFWTAYNKHLLEVIKRIPEEKLSNKVQTGETGEKDLMTLRFIIEDYVEHLEYHLRQIVRYENKKIV